MVDTMRSLKDKNDYRFSNYKSKGPRSILKMLISNEVNIIL